jgi:hypothetical protein
MSSVIHYDRYIELLSSMSQPQKAPHLLVSYETEFVLTVFRLLLP